MSTFEGPGRRPAAGSVNWLLLAIIGLLLFVAVRSWLGERRNVHDPTAAPRPIVARGDLAADEKATIELFRNAAPSAVYITTSAVRRDMFSLNVESIPQGSGSGFIWDEKGHVVTNYHVVQKVIEEGLTAQVTLEDGTHWPAEVIGAAQDKDLAVLKVDASKAKLRALSVGTSKDLEVGQKVFAIGNPFGLDQTLTTGVISGLGREIVSTSRRPIQGVIQTDAAINPGNSGGPLLDSSGRLIGVNTAIFSPSGAYAGIGFAVPVDTVNRIVPELIQHGRVTRPGLGVSLVPDHIVARWGLHGVMLLDVASGSAAEAAGMQGTELDERGRVTRLGDLIVAIDAGEVNTSDDLYRILDRHEVGDEVPLIAVRNEKKIELKIKLQAIQ